MILKRYIFFIFFSLLLKSNSAQTKALNFLPDTTFICAGDSSLIKFPENKVSKEATFTWQTPKAIIVHAKQLYVKYKGLHIIKIIDGKRILIDTTYLKFNDRPTFKMHDTVICGNPIIVEYKNKGYSYLWSNGENTDRIKIDKQGIYWLKLNNKGCSFIDTFKVTNANFAIPNFGKEILICENEPNKLLSVKASSDVKIYWNTGANTPSINATKEGIYWVKSTSKNCGIKTDSVLIKYKNCDCEIFIPNSFTPNEDEKNDLFWPVFQCEYSYFSLTIFDRWGNTVYSSNNITGKWDGKFKSNPCPDDIYVYRLEAIQKITDKKIIRNGHISLFR
ncbi:MAG: gliding motility-associated C-terminal domain-containing protein [Bacteroidia bacterium]|nr:gliding motility-associated C-terminal domain-containing protein [Bacteroidia bacterium]